MSSTPWRRLHAGNASAVVHRSHHAALTTGSADEYESSAPSATSDRTRTALTTGSADEYESTAPTATSDRVLLRSRRFQPRSAP